MTVAIPTPNTAAALRRDTPLSTAPTTRSRKSREYGRAMHAGPLPSMQLESQFRAWRNPLSRLDQAGYRSSMSRPGPKPAVPAKAGPHPSTVSTDKWVPAFAGTRLRSRRVVQDTDDVAGVAAGAI